MENYDLVFSIGFDCKGTQSLRRANLQFFSGPFDWVTGASLPIRADLLAGSFERWFPMEELQDEGRESSDRFANAHKVVRNIRSGLEFRHDFPVDRSVKEGLPEVSEKYRRRLERLQRSIEGSAKALAVYVQGFEAPVPTLNELVSAYDCLRERFGERVDILAICDAEPDTPGHAEVRETARDGHVALFSIPCAQQTSLGPTTNDHAVAEFLRRHVAAPDTRTNAERRAYRRHCRERLYAKYKARTWFGMTVNRIQFRMYRSLLRTLRRKGLVLPAPPRETTL